MGGAPYLCSLSLGVVCEGIPTTLPEYSRRQGNPPRGVLVWSLSKTGDRRLGQLAVWILLTLKGSVPAAEDLGSRSVSWGQESWRVRHSPGVPHSPVLSCPRRVQMVRPSMNIWIGGLDSCFRVHSATSSLVHSGSSSLVHPDTSRWSTVIAGACPTSGGGVLFHVKHWKRTGEGLLCLYIDVRNAKATERLFHFGLPCHRGVVPRPSTNEQLHRLTRLSTPPRPSSVIGVRRAPPGPSLSLLGGILILNPGLKGEILPAGSGRGRYRR